MNYSRLSPFLKFLPQLSVLAIILFFNFLIFPDFFKIEIANGRLYGSVIDVLNRGAPVALLSIGMVLVIATKGIDLSVGAVMAIAGAVAATLVQSGYDWPVALSGALAVGALCGIWNGFLVAVLNIQPIVATLVLMVAGRGIAQLITEGRIVTFLNEGLFFIGGGVLFGLPMPVFIWVISGILVTLIIRRTALGMLIETIGINQRAGYLAGINSTVLLITVYLVAGVCASIAGVIVAADIKGADANNAGLWLELDAILAVVIGGTSLFGGRFSIIGALFGAIIIQAINTGILLSGFPPEFNLVIKAVIIVLILIIQSPVIRNLAISIKNVSSKASEIKGKTA
ncbi:MAG: ABC transporter permease [Methyloligellaceae bacterium]